MVRKKEIMDFRFPLDARHPVHSKVEITIMLYVHLSTVCMNKFVHILVINFWQTAAELLEWFFVYPCALRMGSAKRRTSLPADRALRPMNCTAAEIAIFRRLAVMGIDGGEGFTDEELGMIAEIGSSCANVCLRKATRAVTRRFNEIYSPAGLRSTQTTVLLEIGLHGPISVTQLANILIMDKSTLSRNLKPLVAKGLMEMRRGKGRRREALLTGSGIAAMREILPLWHKAQNEVVAAVGKKAWAGVAKNLRKIARNSAAP